MHHILWKVSNNSPWLVNGIIYFEINGNILFNCRHCVHHHDFVFVSTLTHDARGKDIVGWQNVKFYIHSWKRIGDNKWRLLIHRTTMAQEQEASSGSVEMNWIYIFLELFKTMTKPSESIHPPLKFHEEGGQKEHVFSGRKPKGTCVFLEKVHFYSSGGKESVCTSHKIKK